MESYTCFTYSDKAILPLLNALGAFSARAEEGYPSDTPPARCAVISLSTNRLFNRGAREATRRRSNLLPFLQRPLRDLQLQRRLTVRKVLAFTPRPQTTRERLRRQSLVPRVMSSCPVSHLRRNHAIRDSRIATSRTSNLCITLVVRLAGKGSVVLLWARPYFKIAARGGLKRIGTDFGGLSKARSRWASSPSESSSVFASAMKYDQSVAGNHRDQEFRTSAGVVKSQDRAHSLLYVTHV